MIDFIKIADANAAQLKEDGIKYEIKPSIGNEREASIYLTNGYRVVYTLATNRCKYLNKGYNVIRMKNWLKKNNLEAMK